MSDDDRPTKRSVLITMGAGVVEKDEAHVPRLVLTGEIDANVATDMLNDLDAANLMGWDEIPIEVFSTGGSVGHAARIITAIMASSIPVLTFSSRHNASAAVDVFAAGARRICGPFASFQIHHTVCAGPGGAVTGVCNEVRAVERQGRDALRWLSMRCGQPPGYFQKRLSTEGSNAELFLNANDALECGLVHEIGHVNLSWRATVLQECTVVPLSPIRERKRRRKGHGGAANCSNTVASHGKRSVVGDQG